MLTYVLWDGLAVRYYGPGFSIAATRGVAVGSIGDYKGVAALGGVVALGEISLVVVRLLRI